MTPERLTEIRQFSTKFGCGNCWTGTVGTACTYIHELLELMDETLLPPGMEFSTSAATNHAARKAQPIARGVLDYFPLAIAAVANVSYVANQQHNPGEPMHWAREKSTDHADCIVRHLIDRGKLDSDGLRHTAKIAWRALALLQEELEREGQHATPLQGDSVPGEVVAERSPAAHPTFQELMAEARACNRPLVGGESA